MSYYIVRVKEIWEQAYTVEATSKEDAIEKVKHGEAELQEDAFEYSDTMPSEQWKVEEGTDD